MGEVFEQVKLRAAQKRRELDAALDPDRYDLLKMARIEKLFARPDCFRFIGALDGMVMLKFLGYEWRACQNMTYQLQQEQEDAEIHTPIRGRLRCRDDNGGWYLTEPLDLDPVYERYYQGDFCVIKIPARGLFYLLVNGQWKWDPEIEPDYYDAASRYWELGYVPEPGYPDPREGIGFEPPPEDPKKLWWPGKKE